MGIAEILKLEKTDRKAYEESLKKHRDLKNVIDSHKRMGFEEGKEEGREEGRKEGKKETAIGCYTEGVDIKIISKVTELSEEELLELFRKEGLA